MKVVGEVVGGIFILILVYLFLRRGQETVAVINTLGQNAISGIRVLQGRD